MQTPALLGRSARSSWSSGVLAVLGLVGLAACDEPKREPPHYTPTSGTGTSFTTGTGSGGAGGGTTSSTTSSGSTSTASTGTTSASSSATGATSSATGGICMSMDCEPPCAGFDTCIEVTPCDFQCTQGAVGDPCATTNDCVATLQCVNHTCE